MRALTAGVQSSALLESTFTSRASRRAFAVTPSNRVRAVSSRPAVSAGHASQAQRTRLVPVQASEEQAASAFDYEEPETAKEGIDLGLVLCKQGRWQDALGIFEKSLKLPGTGVKRFRDKPRLVSDGEKMALLYNIACCHSRMQDARSGLMALAGCMEAGYLDFQQVRTDPDLEFLRADSRFEGLMERFEKKPGGFMGFDLSALFGQK